MNTKTLLAMAIASTAALGHADAQEQTVKEFTLSNSVSGGSDFRKYYPYGISAWPCTEADVTLFYDTTLTLSAFDAKGNVTPLCTFDEIRKATGGKGFQILRAYDAKTIELLTAEGHKTFDLAQKCATASTAAEYDDQSLAPGRNAWMAYTAGMDLHVAKGDETRRVTPPTEEGVRYGSTVHRNEFGIGGGMFWSPDGQRLCFYRKDEAMVTNYPLVDVTERVAQLENSRYPMAGMTSEQVSMGIYDIATKSTIYLKTASPVDRYFTNISWSPDGKLIAVAEVNRDQNHMWFNLYDSRTGNLERTLFEESNEKWIEPCAPALWTDDTHFVWASYRDGFRHLYLYDLKAKGDAQPRQLTSGSWCVTDVYGYDAATGKLLVQTNSDGYLYRNVATVTLKGKMKSLTPAGSYSVATYSNGNSTFACSISRHDMAKEWHLMTTDGKVDKVVKSIVNPYEGFAMPRVELVSLTSADGKHPLSGRIIYPSDFDASKSYPVMVYVYGGPHSQLVDGSWLYGAGAWMLTMAEKGYIVFTMDNRGTEMRGSEFEQAVHRQLGKCEMEDQMVGVRYLQSLPYVDKSRIGVHGWSFGGFMTLSLLTTYPDVFCAGVAGGPVCDWKYYEVMYGERYMDTPEQNPEGYESTSLLNKIGNLKSRALVIHGAMDSTVVWQHSQQLLNAAIEKGVFVDFAIYPNHAHNVIGKDRPHLMGYIFRYFDDWVKGARKGE